jgi:hypothetical protein
MLDAAGCIEILTGKQQRRIQEYLHSVFGGDPSTHDDWQKFFEHPNPENVPYDDWHEAQVVFGLYAIPMSRAANSPR